MRPHPHHAPLLWVRVAGLLALAGCAGTAALPSAPVRIVEGKRTRVQLIDLRSRLTLALQNESSGSAKDVYSDPAGQVTVKVVEDAELQKLLDVLAERGMFAQAASAPSADASAAIVVQQQGRTWVWSRPPVRPETVDAVQTFEQGRGYVLTVYNAATSWHWVDDNEMKAIRGRIEGAKSAQEQKGEPVAPREIPPAPRERSK